MELTVEARRGDDGDTAFAAASKIRVCVLTIGSRAFDGAGDNRPSPRLFAFFPLLLLLPLAPLELLPR